MQWLMLPQQLLTALFDNIVKVWTIGQVAWGMMWGMKRAAYDSATIGVSVFIAANITAGHVIISAILVLNTFGLPSFPVHWDCERENKMFTFGQKLDYLTIWAGGPGFTFYRAWFGGIRFCCYESGMSRSGNKTALVWKKCFGRWMKIRYFIHELRPAKLEKGKCESLGLTDLIGRPVFSN